MADFDSAALRAQAATSAGVQELIDRIHDQGVKAGREKAEAIVEEARREAERTLREAQKGAATLLQEAREEAARVQEAGQEALRIASRDTIMRFNEEMMALLEQRVRRLVSVEMVDRELLRSLILQVAARPVEAVVQGAERVAIHLPPEPLGIEELKRDPKALEDALSRLVKQIAGETWREGVTFHASGQLEQGIRVEVKDQDLNLDLSPQAVADLLLLHLQPRFRALMQGIIQ